MQSIDSDDDINQNHNIQHDHRSVSPQNSGATGSAAGNMVAYRQNY
jgi:hypothetical protein